MDLHIFPLLSHWLSGKEFACQCRRCRFNPSLKKEMATYSSILAWKIPWTEESGEATVHRITKSHTQLSNQTTPLLLIIKVTWKPREDDTGAISLGS